MSNVKVIPSDPDNGPRIHTVVKAWYFPACLAGSCADGQPMVATHLMPWTDNEGGFEWVPVCDIHVMGWWDGVDPTTPTPAGYQLVAIPDGRLEQ